MQSRDPLVGKAGVALILALLAVQVGSGLRLTRLHHPDEVWTFDALQRPFTQLLTFILGQDNHPPLYYLTAKLWTSIAGDSIEAIRLLSFVFALVTLVVMALFHFRHRSIPLLAPVLLVASNPLFTYYAATVRPYAMVVCLATIATLSAVVLRESEPLVPEQSSFGPGGLQRGALQSVFFLSCLLLGLTHYYGTLYACLLLGWDFLDRRICSSRVSSLLVFAALSIWPILQVNFGSLDRQIESNSWVNLQPFVSTFNNLMMGVFPSQLLSRQSYYIFSLSLLVLLGLIVIGPLSLAQLKRFQCVSLGGLLGSRVGQLTTVVMMVYLFSVAADLLKPFSTPYYFLVCLPAVALVFGSFCRRLRQRFGGLAAALFVAGVVVTQLVLTQQRLSLP